MVVADKERTALVQSFRDDIQNTLFAIARFTARLFRQECHRVALIKQTQFAVRVAGGIYLYPSTASHPDGKLRLLYECNPMAFLAEQAGGKASDGKERILDIIPETLHQRRSFFVGNDHMVEDVERFIREFPDA